MKRIFAMISFFVLLTGLCLPVSAAEEWPQDASDVAYALAARVTGQQGFQNITFAPGTGTNLEGAQNGFYAPFKAGKIVLVGYTNHGTGSVYDAGLAGVINLKDASGRLVALQFVANYTVNGGNITINQCAAATASPPTVPMEVYMVPVAAFQELPYGAATDWTALYGFVQDKSYIPSMEDAKKGQYMVVTFVKSRLPADAKFEALVGSKKKTRRSKDNLARKNQRYLSFQGWRVHMFAAKFKPTALRERFYINYYYTPGLGMPESERERTLIARYDSKPSAESKAPAARPKPVVTATPVATPAPKAVPAPVQQKAPEPAPVPAQQPAPVVPSAPAQVATAQPAEGPLARGLSFLNPIFPDDVALIQQRLISLGRYGGPVDKTFGPTTKRSLDNFASEHGFPKGQWSLGLQKALFEGSGL